MSYETTGSGAPSGVSELRYDDEDASGLWAHSPSPSSSASAPRAAHGEASTPLGMLAAFAVLTGAHLAAVGSTPTTATSPRVEEGRPSSAPIPASVGAAHPTPAAARGQTTVREQWEIESASSRVDANAATVGPSFSGSDQGIKLTEAEMLYILQQRQTTLQQGSKDPTPSPLPSCTKTQARGKAGAQMAGLEEPTIYKASPTPARIYKGQTEVYDLSKSGIKAMGATDYDPRDATRFLEDLRQRGEQGDESSEQKDAHIVSKFFDRKGRDCLVSTEAAKAIRDPSKPWPVMPSITGNNSQHALEFTLGVILPHAAVKPQSIDFLLGVRKTLNEIAKMLGADGRALLHAMAKMPPTANVVTMVEDERVWTAIKARVGPLTTRAVTVLVHMMSWCSHSPST